MYNQTVRIGNWIEDIELEKERIAAFLEKRESGKLLVQHTRRLFENLLRETSLSKNNDGFVKFGSFIQLRAPDMPNSPPPSFAKQANDNHRTSADYGVVIAGTIHDKHIEDTTSLTNDCQLVSSPVIVPCARNTFVIRSADNTDKNGQNLLFGQEFALEIVDTSSEKLYVRSEKPLIDGQYGPLDHYPVRLSNKFDRYSTWKVLHWDRESRLESEGAPFPPFTRIVLRHTMSGHDMAVEGTVWWTTIFGNECGLSVHTYLNVSKRETAECLWIFVTDEYTRESSSEESSSCRAN